MQLDTGEDTPRPPTHAWDTTGALHLENELNEKEEYTTKGRKRKRLAKACSACHVGAFSNTHGSAEIVWSDYVEEQTSM